jgi:hypothetical protein
MPWEPHGQLLNEALPKLLCGKQCWGGGVSQKPLFEEHLLQKCTKLNDENKAALSE